jgi:hypothetical protein
LLFFRQIAEGKNPLRAALGRNDQLAVFAPDVAHHF